MDNFSQPKNSEERNKKGSRGDEANALIIFKKKHHKNRPDNEKNAIFGLVAKESEIKGSPCWRENFFKDLLKRWEAGTPMVFAKKQWQTGKNNKKNSDGIKSGEIPLRDNKASDKRSSDLGEPDKNFAKRKMARHLFFWGILNEKEMIRNPVKGDKQTADEARPEKESKIFLRENKKSEFENKKNVGEKNCPAGAKAGNKKAGIIGKNKSSGRPDKEV